MKMTRFFLCSVAAYYLLISGASAGFFNTARFVEAKRWSIGFEPELTFTRGSGLGANLKFTQGFNDLLNLAGIMGTGGGARGFRIGPQAVFDFFPDVEGQPGIGLAIETIYYRIFQAGRLELTASPYIHKTFETDSGGNIAPFLAFPIGFSVGSDDTRNIAHVAVGTMIKRGEHFDFVVELGVNVNNYYTTFSGGVAYYY